MVSNFHGKSEKALKLIFMVLNFMTATSLGVWHYCIRSLWPAHHHGLAYIVSP